MSKLFADAELTETLPIALKKDPRIVALAKTVAIELKKNIEAINSVGIYYRVDELDENILDMLGEDMHIDYYRSTMSKEQKINAVNNGIKYHKLCGTAAAVNMAMEALYGSGETSSKDVANPVCEFMIRDVGIDMYSDIEGFLEVVENTRRATAVFVGATTMLEFFVDVDTYPDEESDNEYLTDDAAEYLTDDDKEYLYV